MSSSPGDPARSGDPASGGSASGGSASGGSASGGSASGDGPSGRDEAPLAAETFVRDENGRFYVDLVVMFPSGAVRRTINNYSTRRHAEIAASWIKRGADRDIEGPPIYG